MPMDVHDQFAVVRSRPLARVRGLLGLLVVLALLASAPASALADRAGVAGPHQLAATVLTQDVVADDETPPATDPAPPATDPLPPATDPAPPAEPAPAEPAPAEPAPAEPAPTDPAPADPAPPAEPAPTEPAPPAEPAPAEPAPTEPVATDPAPPQDPAPRDGRSPAPKQPTDTHVDPGTERAAPTPDLASLPVAEGPDPAATTPQAPAEPTATADHGAARQAKAVREALARLGIGTVAAPAVVDAAAVATALPAPACTTMGSVVVTPSPQAAAAMAARPVVRPHRGTDQEPPHLRGPPAPLHTPSGPSATAGAAAAAAGGASGERDSAIEAAQISFELTDGEIVVAGDCAAHVAPAPAKAAARAPPVA
jgi:hypothetical protein